MKADIGRAGYESFMAGVAALGEEGRDFLDQEYKLKAFLAESGATLPPPDQLSALLEAVAVAEFEGVCSEGMSRSLGRGLAALYILASLPEKE